MDKTKRTKKQAPLNRVYSESFKRMVVSEYDRGYLNKDQLQRKYHIGGNSCILNWLRKYSTFIPPTHSIGRPMKDADKQRIKELEALLKKKQQEIDLFKRVIEVAERELKISIIKKSGTK